MVVKDVTDARENGSARYPRVVVILVLYNSLKYLPECLESLSKLNYPAEALKIIAVDNQSPEPEAEYLRKSWSQVKVLVSAENSGYAGGNNLGLKKALAEGFDYAWVLNPDTVMEADSLKKMVAAGEADEEIGCLQPKILIYDQPELIQTGGNQMHYLGLAYSGGYKQPTESLTGAPRPVAYASGAALLLKREVLEQVGLFEERFFMYHEDADLGWRAWLAGFKSVVVPEAVIYHKYSFSRNNRKYFYMERNRWWCMLKNYKAATLVVLAPAWLLFEIGIWSQSILGGWWGWKIKALWESLPQGDWLWKERARIQKERVMSDRKFLRLTTGELVFPDFSNPAVWIANRFFMFYRWLVLKIVWW